MISYPIAYAYDIVCITCISSCSIPGDAGGPSALDALSSLRLERSSDEEIMTPKGMFERFGSCQGGRYPTSPRTLPRLKCGHPRLHVRKMKCRGILACHGVRDSVLAEVTRLRKDLPKSDSTDLRKSFKSQPERQGLNHSDDDIYSSR